MIAVATGDEIADQLARLAVFAKADGWLGGVVRIIEIVDAGVGDFQMKLHAGGESRVSQIFHDSVLRVDGDRFSSGEIREVNAMRAAAKTQITSVMPRPFALRPSAPP